MNLQAAKGSSRIINSLMNIFAAALSVPARIISLYDSRLVAQPADRKRRDQGKAMTTASSDCDHIELRTIVGEVMS